MTYETTMNLALTTDAYSELTTINNEVQLPTLEQISEVIMFAGSKVVEFLSTGVEFAKEGLNYVADLVQNLWFSILPLLAMVSPMTPLGQSLILGALGVTFIVAALNSESCTKYILGIAAIACAFFAGGAASSAIRAFDIPVAPVIPN